jgi:predicted ABC-type transport system involved in lysophospholipase L1 biosynthesis ATPase subunit
MVTHDPEVAAFSRRNLMFRDGRLIDDISTGVREGTAS